MKKQNLLSLGILFLSSFLLQTKIYCQKIGDDASQVKFLVELYVQNYYNAQGYHSVRMESKTVMINGTIGEVILKEENVPDISLRRPVSFVLHYMMKGGRLNRIIQEYLDVTLAELKNATKNDWQGNIINDYYFNEDYTNFTKNYLNANNLATKETRAVVLDEFPIQIQSLLKDDILRVRNEKIQKHKENLNTSANITNRSPLEREVVSEFPGGEKGLIRYLSQNLHYPDSAVNNRIQGIIKVQFTVEADGSVQEAEVVEGNGIGYGLPEEAIRVVSNMPKWLPAVQNGKYVKSYKKMPIVFKLEDDSTPN